MIVRSLDVNGDFTYGRGKNDYKKDNDAIVQLISTRLKSFLGDCFFAVSEGIDWFNLIGSKRQLELKLAISATILNTEGVTGIGDVSLNLDRNRLMTITYTAQTTYSVNRSSVNVNI